MIYNLFETKILKDIKIGFIILSVVFSILCLIGIVCSFLIKNGIYVLIIFFLMGVLILLCYFSYSRKYLITVKIKENILEVYAGRKLKRAYNIKEFKYKIADVIITLKTRGQDEIISSSLILYKDIELYDLMEYPSYWNNQNILIIQNNELIKEVLNLINTNI